MDHIQTFPMLFIIPFILQNILLIIMENMAKNVQCSSSVF